MRKLSNNFMRHLLTGFLNPVLVKVKKDRDLVLEIRENYLNIYFKGQSLLRLSPSGSVSKYKIEINKKFKRGLENLPTNLNSPQDVKIFLSHVPVIKDRITEVKGSGTEIEFEQALIRANNDETRLNTEYFIVDRQIVGKGAKDQLDLLGFYWPSKNRSKNRFVELAIIEVKYSLNPDISDIANQLKRYYKEVCRDLPTICRDVDSIFQQKLELGLLKGTPNQLKAMREFRIKANPDKIRIVIALVDYNPMSKKLQQAVKSLQALPFSDQIEVYFLGFGLWTVNSETVAGI